MFDGLKNEIRLEEGYICYGCDLQLKGLRARLIRIEVQDKENSTRQMLGAQHKSLSYTLFGG